MNDLTFVLPSLGLAQMPRQDQMELLIVQATTAIVCAYLEHMNKTIEKGPALPPNPSLTTSNILSPQEMVTLINSVQGALRASP